MLRVMLSCTIIVNTVLRMKKNRRLHRYIDEAVGGKGVKADSDDNDKRRVFGTR
ncbi:hypothetical protein SDC9_140181 [bioreactor metagenome]|uniref:Uncharacterized protein n=1 Tax=bioreactor metagenome TaxID=1076179 RepID=A0A645DUT4_9ZZZZ